LADVDLLADDFGTSETKCNAVIHNAQLFEVDAEKHFFSPKQIDFLQPYFKAREQRRQAGIKSGQKRRQRAISSTAVQRSLNESQTDVEQVKKSKEKKSKENESKEEQTSNGERVYLHENPSLNYNYTPNNNWPHLRQPTLEVLSHFGFTETKNPDKLKQVFATIRTLAAKDRLSYFLEQFKGFADKYPTGDRYLCNLSDFLGTPAENYENGKWNAKIYTLTPDAPLTPQQIAAQMK
jgi:hypothetical protein